MLQGSGVQMVQRMQGSRGCRAQGCRGSRIQTILKGTDNTGDAGNRGVLGAGLRGSRIPESAGVHRAQGTGDAGLRGAGV